MKDAEINPIVRTVADTQSEMTEMILPNDSNSAGQPVGRAADEHFIDLTGAMAAYRHARTHGAAAMDHIAPSGAPGRFWLR